jgi:hypothetical protein
MTTSSDVDDLGERAADARDRLDNLVSELDRRRHLVTRARQTLASRPAWTAGGALLLAGLVTGTVALIARHRRNEGRLSTRARRLRVAVGRMTSHPERVARPEPSMGKKIMTALVTTILTTVARQALSKAMASPRRRPRPATGSSA